MAGLLNIQLGGVSSYFGKVVEKPTIGDRSRVSVGRILKRIIEIMYRAEILLLILYGLIYI